MPQFHWSDCDGCNEHCKDNQIRIEILYAILYNQYFANVTFERVLVFFGNQFGQSTAMSAVIQTLDNPFSLLIWLCMNPFIQAVNDSLRVTIVMAVATSEPSRLPTITVPYSTALFPTYCMSLLAVSQIGRVLANRCYRNRALLFIRSLL